MTLETELFFSLSLIIPVSSVGCVTQDDGQLKPILSNMEIGLPVAIANKALGKNPMKILRGEISQESNCLRQYPISRLKLIIEAAKADTRESMKRYFFYPDDWKFQKEFEFDSASTYRVKLVYEPEEKVLSQKLVSVQETIDVFLKIDCPATES